MKRKYNIARLSAMFTTEPIRVDGVMDEAYANAEAGLIHNVKDGTQPADYKGGAAATGTVWSVWDGGTLYLFVDVTDPTPAYNTRYRGLNKAEAIGDGDAYDWALFQTDPEKWHKPGTYSVGDAVEFAVDFWNDKVPKFQDDDGLFSITRDGYLTYFAEGMVKNHSSVYAQKENREYNNRIRAWAAQEKADGSGYCVELALALDAGDWEYDENGYLKYIERKFKNGITLGIDVMIGDSPADNTPRNSRTYWSHSDNSLPFSSRDFNADWGEITLTGWQGEPFAFCDWSLRNAIRFVESPSLQKGVWSAGTQRALDEALSGAKAAAEYIKQAAGLADRRESMPRREENLQAAADAAAARLISAVNGLRWADDTYPDPMDLPACFTLPNPYRFFDGSAVKAPADWPVRRKEILRLAQFYEYGFKPAPPDKLTIDGVEQTRENVFSWMTGKNEDVEYYKVSVTATYGGVSASTFFKLELPEAGVAHGLSPVMLSFDAATKEYLEAGFAVLTIPAGDMTDDRNDPWSGRSGFMRSFFPYDRTSAKEISNEMAAAWECSIAIDALEKLAAERLEIGNLGTADTLIIPDKLAVTGFSICGKYAFVSAVFDERIGVCVPSAAGCTGPSVYRYAVNNDGGLIWSWGVSTGCEVMGDTIRHNPGRTIELFRRFLTPGRFYKIHPGNPYGYGERLPYDHEELVATLAPRAIVLQSTIDDYADQSVGDALSLTLAKSIYRWLGNDPDMLVMYNFRDGTDHGEGNHGEDSDQRKRTAAYLDWYFRGKAMDGETLKRLQTDPFYNDVIDGVDGYTRNFGGLKAMAPWLNDHSI